MDVDDPVCLLLCLPRRRLLLPRRRLPACVQAVLDTWAGNLAVVVHCRASYHRGPLAVAALTRRLSRLEPEAIWQTLSRARQIWPGYLQCHEAGWNYSGLFNAKRWVDQITPDLCLWRPGAQDLSAMTQTSRFDS